MTTLGSGRRCPGWRFVCLVLAASSALAQDGFRSAPPPAPTVGFDLGQGSRVLDLPGPQRPFLGGTLPPIPAKPAEIRRVGASARWLDEIRSRRTSLMARSHEARAELRGSSRPTGSAARDRLAELRAVRSGRMLTPEGFVDPYAPTAAPAEDPRAGDPSPTPAPTPAPTGQGGGSQESSPTPRTRGIFRIGGHR